ncbi:MAG TPA: alpha/beta hydrolase [Spirochaetales bacterium]|nr:alpha/beta hydrolase [Spirochaetales bacterium]
MEQRKYGAETLNAIKDRQYVKKEEGLDILIKPIPETDEPGVFDPRFYASIAPMVTGVKGWLFKVMMKLGSRKAPDIAKGAAQMRQMMDGIKSIPIVGSVDVREDFVDAGDADSSGALDSSGSPYLSGSMGSSTRIRIPIRIYTLADAKHDGLQPVFYYIHGGGFAAGSMDVVDEMCKLVVEKTGCVAVQVGYRLAPENPYPAGLDDCYAVLQWIYRNATSFGGDPERICICGDSAGGNYATVCAMRDRDDSLRDGTTRKIKAEALLYPVVDLAHSMENMQAARAVYEVSPKHAKLLNGMLDGMVHSLGRPSMSEYLGVEDATQPYLSPLLGDLAGMPPTIILLGEFDFLRVEDDRYAHKLNDSGVEVRLIRYKGLSHGFADQVGVTPQAEDALEEIGDFMMSHLGRKI